MLLSPCIVAVAVVVGWLRLLVLWGGGALCWGGGAAGWCRGGTCMSWRRGFHMCGEEWRRWPQACVWQGGAGGDLRGLRGKAQGARLACAGRGGLRTGPKPSHELTCGEAMRQLRRGREKAKLVVVSRGLACCDGMTSRGGFARRGGWWWRILREAKDGGAMGWCGGAAAVTSLCDNGAWRRMVAAMGWREGAAGTLRCLTGKVLQLQQ
ncbi:hypothetical protein EDB84DRAFT_1438438 [Lactarius hengduanensis]|nr:hypothetical protein EDB84DRAFT_1438438 [Lactarius hengduanensis]